MEVFPLTLTHQKYQPNFLHVCGGVSTIPLFIQRIKLFSPRMWRCFSVDLLFLRAQEIFSTYVEVFPVRKGIWRHLAYFLHVCGGVSRETGARSAHLIFSPRMWRCFYADRRLRRRDAIFSTYVEVFPIRHLRAILLLYFLHVCGGVSKTIRLHWIHSEFSPRMWRCFCRIFKVNCELRNFLHVCGGVSYFLFSVCSMLRFSPRMWRCFSCAYVARYVTKIFSTYVEVFLLFRKLSGVSIIFSTYVEVFPSATGVPPEAPHFLHVCGGVSDLPAEVRSEYGFSPRMWRCFLLQIASGAMYLIFSTYVEVFPILSCS